MRTLPESLAIELAECRGRAFQVCGLTGAEGDARARHLRQVVAFCLIESRLLPRGAVAHTLSMSPQMVDYSHKAIAARMAAHPGFAREVTAMVEALRPPGLRRV